MDGRGVIVLTTSGIQQQKLDQPREKAKDILRTLSKSDICKTRKRQDSIPIITLTHVHVYDSVYCYFLLS